MTQEVETKRNIIEDIAFSFFSTASIYLAYEGIRYLFKRLDKKKSHEDRMKEAQFKHDCNMEQLRYKKEMGNKSKPDTTEQVNEEHEWEDLSEVVNDPDACKKIEYFPGTPVHKGDLCCIYSPTGQGKSTLVMQMLIAIASGKNAGIVNDNRPDYKSHVVYLYDSELTKEDFQVRYGKSGLDLSNIRMMQSSNFYEIEMLVENIKNTIAKETHDCVVAIDNMTDMFPRLKEEQVRQFKSSLSRIQKDASDKGVTVTFIVVHHSVKNSKGKGVQEMAGSVNWNRLFKTVIAISPSDFGDDYKILKVEKDRSASRRNNIIIKRVESPYLHFEYYLEESEILSSQDIELEMPESIDGIPTKVIEDMYRLKNTKVSNKKYVSYGRIIKCYGSQYNLKYPEQVKRLFLKYLKEKDKATKAKQ